MITGCSIILSTKLNINTNGAASIPLPMGCVGINPCLENIVIGSLE